MKIGIRADGNSSIGMGHIMRTLVLAKELAKYNEVFYICRTEDNTLFNIGDKYKNGLDKIYQYGFRIKLVREEYLIEDLKKINSDLLITDSYDVDEMYFNETKKVFKNTAYIDDMNLMFFNVDFIINQNINAGDFNYKTNNDTKLMLGPEYIMLREEFRNAPKKKINRIVEDIMVTVGGGDPYYITEKFLGYINGLKYKFHVVVGPSFTNIDELKKLQDHRIKFYYNADMYSIMQKCDLAISACGSTVYELCACGVPTLGIIIADNQEKIGIKLDELGIIKNLGWYDKINKGKFIKSIRDICENYDTRVCMSNKGRSIIDGKGVERIVQELMKRR